MCLLNDTSLALLYAPVKLCQLGFPEINQNLNHYTVPCITSVNELVWKASRWILPGLALETPETLRQFKGSGQREGPFVGQPFPGTGLGLWNHIAGLTTRNRGTGVKRRW